MAEHPTAAVARHYDSLDSIYRSVWGEHVHHGYWISGSEPAARAVEQLVELVADAAVIGPGSRVCDVGCGYGATARSLVAGRGALVTGVTVSPAQQRYAERAAAGGNPRILLGDWLENELPDASFDAVVAIESISHMRDRPRVFAECHRVLAPGGRLVVLDWLAAAKARQWQQRLLLEPICREGHLPGLDTLGNYGELLLAAGFADVSGRDISRHVWRTWPIVLARGVRRLPGDRELRRLLLDRSHSERGFLPMVLRLMAGYATRGFRYGMLTAQRPG
ncbi:MAG: methyltransferase domain-containing protein [Solirubrobacteraceae bacterium]